MNERWMSPQSERSNCLFKFAMVAAVAAITASGVAGAVTSTTVAPAAAAKEASDVAPATDADRKVLKAIDETYKKAPALSADVKKTLKLGLLGQERKAEGKLWISSNRLRMELEGSPKTLLVVNKKNFWAVTYPSAEFKDAAIQVIAGETTTKKGRSQNFVSLLTEGGISKYFNATGVKKLASGEKLFFLQPNKDQIDLKRAQLTVSADGKYISGLSFWDEKENETIFTFSNVVFAKKAHPNTLFTYAPPANADVMKY